MLEAELLASRSRVRPPQGTGPENFRGDQAAHRVSSTRNVSGVLVELGLPYIEGYKPRSNYQGASPPRSRVSLTGTRHPRQAGGRTDGQPAQGAVRRTRPRQDHRRPAGEDRGPGEPTGKPWLARKARKIDFAERTPPTADSPSRRQSAFDLERIAAGPQAGTTSPAGRVGRADIADGLGSTSCLRRGRRRQAVCEVKRPAGKFFPFYSPATRSATPRTADHSTCITPA